MNNLALYLGDFKISKLLQTAARLVLAMMRMEGLAAQRWGDSVNDLVFTRRGYTKLARSYGLMQSSLRRAARTVSSACDYRSVMLFCFVYRGVDVAAKLYFSNPGTSEKAHVAYKGLPVDAAV